MNNDNMLFAAEVAKLSKKQKEPKKAEKPLTATIGDLIRNASGNITGQKGSTK